MKYDLVSINGNAFNIMAYVRNALIKSGHDDMIENYIADAKSGDYNHILAVYIKYTDIANLLKE